MSTTTKRATKKAAHTATTPKKQVAAESPAPPQAVKPSVEDPKLEDATPPQDVKPSVEDPKPEEIPPPDVPSDESGDRRAASDTPTVEEPTPTKVLTLSARAVRHTRAILEPYLSAAALDDNMDRIVAHVETGRCALVFSQPPSVQLVDTPQHTVTRDALKAEHGSGFRFEISQALRKSQVL